MNIKNLLEDIKTQLAQGLPELDLEIYSRDISQYQFTSQTPVGVITLGSADFSESPHKSINSQKASVELGFYYFSRTADDSTIEDLSAFTEAISDIEGVSLSYLKVRSHQKDVAIFEIKAFIDEIFN